jgi:hypothetical protein
MRGFGSLWHLAGRFFGSLSPAGPEPSAERWALDELNPGEQALFARMSGPDRRHAITVARDAEQLASADGVERAALPDGFAAAALMHDVGKVESGLGTFGRVFATVLALGLGRDRVLGWRAATSGWRARTGAYVCHDTIGADLLRAAGSNDLVVSWAREHHMPDSRWSVDRKIGRWLKDADGD